MKRRYQRMFVKKLCSAVERIAKPIKVLSIEQVKVNESAIFIVNNKKVYRKYKNLKYLNNIKDIKVIDMSENTVKWYKIS